MPRTKRQTSTPKSKSETKASQSSSTKANAANAAPKSVQEIKRAFSRQMMQYPIVSGVGIETNAEGKDQIKVYLNADDKEFCETLPKEVEGIPVVAEMIGSIDAY